MTTTKLPARRSPRAPGVRGGLLALAGLLLVAAACEAPPPPPQRLTDAERESERLWADRCASCHQPAGAAGPEGVRAPALDAMRSMSSAAVAFALTNGRMSTQAAGIDPFAIAELAAWVASPLEPYEPRPADSCSDRSVDTEFRAVARWGFDASNSGALAPGVSELRAANVGGLRLAWAFGLPHTVTARSQPAITGDTLFVAAEDGSLFALDRHAGCVKWHRRFPAALRTALTLGDAGDTPALFAGDLDQQVHAVAAASGELLWSSGVALAEHSLLTGGIVQHGNALYVPVSLYEVALAADPDYECCRSHGGVVKLDARTGERLWEAHLTPEAEPRGRTSAGTLRWGPSGVPVWSTPTVDPERGVLYVGTGQNASAPATELSDSVVALDLDTGQVVWHFQSTAGDTYNTACSMMPPGPNCPSWQGPDFDFGASVILARTRAGEPVLLAGQKSGDVFALDPDDAGRMLWHQRAGAGSALGGIHWGMAAASGVVFAPVSDPPYPATGYRPRPGVTAFDAATGERLWEHRLSAPCDTSFLRYLQRDALYPDCSFFFGISAAPALVGDLLFVATLDGTVRALAVDTGAELWSVNTVRPYETVNGVAAHGGSIDAAGVQVAGRMLYVQSGYALFGQLPGNVLLAFELPAEAGS